MGGMGTVYLTQREVVAGVVREFAVKVLHPQLRAEGELAAALLREAQLAARIEHKNVVRTVEALDLPQGVAVVMDYVEGDTLAGLIRLGGLRHTPIPVAIVARIMSDALEGLHAAHEMCDDDGVPLGVVHRDFSPQNILVGLDGVARLTDFGVAKVTSQIGTTTTGMTKGKVSYMSPEQALGQAVDRRCDVWAAGVVVWEALAGKRLFRGENEIASLMMMLNGGAPPVLSERRPEVPAEIDDVVLAALARDQSARLGSAEAMRQRLLAAVGDVASHDEVARYVRELTRDKMAERRAEIGKAKRLNEELSSVHDRATKAAVRAAESFSPRQPVSSPPSVAAGLREVAEDAAGLRRSPQWLALAGAIAAGAAAVWLAQSPAPSRRVATLLVVGNTDALLAVASNTVADSSESSEGLTIVANSPIQQIAINGAMTLLRAAVLEVTVPIPRESLEVVLFSADGRQARTVIAPGTTRVALAFPRRARVSATPAPVPARPKSPTLIEDPL